MFFEQGRQHFFNPLTGKYREQVTECLRLLYRRLYSELRDYSTRLDRDTLLGIFTEALTRCPTLLDGDGAEQEGRFKNLREQAGFILARLLECGWLEKQVDTASLSSHYAFSRYGRLFTQPFVEGANTKVRTRHRNTRNTRNSLQAFLDKGEVHDLLDACDYSERIISDFSDVIAELEDRKRALVKEVEAQQLVQKASDEFFDFMEKRFAPDISIRLSADSVEKYRQHILELIEQIKAKPKAWKADAERELRRLLPGEVRANQSLLWRLLDTIARRLGDACDTMLPALRATLNSFTQRAEIIMRQLSYLHSGERGGVVEACQQLRKLDAAGQTQALEQLGDGLSGVRLRFVDPGQNQLRSKKSRRQVYSQVSEGAPIDRDERRKQVVQQAIDQAFNVHGGEIKNYLLEALGDLRQIRTHHLPLHSANDLLNLSHIIELAAADNLGSEYRFVIEPTGERIEAGDDYFQYRDGFSITLEDA